MTRKDIISQIITQRREEHYFVKLFRSGHTLADIDQIEGFINGCDHGEEYDEFELLDMEQMWQTLIDLDPDKLVRSGNGRDEIIEWLWTDSDGTEKKFIFPFTPEGIMKIMDDEFFA